MKISVTRFCHFFRVNIWYINVTCDDNFVFSFPRLLLLNKSKCTKSTVMYDPTYESRDITRSRNHVINHCRKLEMAYETPFIIFWNRTQGNNSKWFMIFRLTRNRFRDDRESWSTWSTWRSFYGISDSHVSTILKDPNDFVHLARSHTPCFAQNYIVCRRIGA